jgi:Holliday junction resolvase RusA-like endonuclease
LTNRIVVTAYGLPAPQGSKRGFVAAGRAVIVDDNKPALRTWRDDVKLAALRALDATPDWDPTAQVVSLHATFTLPRPRSHYRTGKQTLHLLRDAAPEWPHTRPDLDKLLRAAGDALKAAGVYADDSRIVKITATKVYPTHTRYPPGALDRPGAHLVVVAGVRMTGLRGVL